MANSKTWCGLPFILGAIGGTHVSISKPLRPFVEDYYYHKIGGHNIVVQAIINYKKESLIYLLASLVMSMIRRC
jgi:hypothetical protein